MSESTLIKTGIIYIYNTLQNYRYIGKNSKRIKI